MKKAPTTRGRRSQQEQVVLPRGKKKPINAKARLMCYEVAKKAAILSQPGVGGIERLVKKKDAEKQRTQR